MKKISVFVMILACLQSGAQIVVDNTQTVEYYVENVLLGEGVEAFNITFNGMPADMVSLQVGSFDCADCNVGIPSGFVMASGDAQVVVGPNNSGGLTLGGGEFFDGDDPDLNAISSGFGINDWSIIEFDFIPAGDSVKFNYVWGSEEYMEWVNSSFNDIFGFFLSGPGIDGPYSNNGINIALIPGTSLPVTIDNVNANLNGQYYVDNGDGFESPFSTDDFYIQFDGITVVLTAEAEVQCGETYHIKLACADSGDSALDCGVFFEEGSFSSNFVTISSEIAIENPPTFLGEATILEGCVDGQFTIFPPADLDQDTTVVLTISGTAVNGTDYELISGEITLTPDAPTIVSIVPLTDNLVESTEDVTVEYIYENSCGQVDTAYATLFIADYQPVQVVMDDVFICPGDNAIADPDVSGGADEYTYLWSTGAQTATVVFESGDEGEYTVSVTDYCGTEGTATFNVIEPLPFEPIDSTDLCLGSLTGELATGGALPYDIEYNEQGLEFQQSTIFEGLAIGQYIVEITDGCGQSADIPVTVEECDTVIPNVFTPNGDNANETFTIRGVEGFPKSTLLIYSRWGGLILEDDNYTNDWRGTDQPDGVYYYIFKRSDGKNFEGYFHLLRGK